MVAYDASVRARFRGRSSSVSSVARLGGGTNAGVGSAEGVWRDRKTRSLGSTDKVGRILLMGRFSGGALPDATRGVSSSAG